MTAPATAPEPTELEKLQQEYNQKAFLFGNSHYKSQLLLREQANLSQEMEKISLQAAELMKKKDEPKEEEKPEEQVK